MNNASDLKRLNKLKKEYARKSIYSVIDMAKSILALIVIILFEKFSTHHVFVSFCCAIIGIWEILSIMYFVKELSGHLIEYRYCSTEIRKLEKEINRKDSIP